MKKIRIVAELKKQIAKELGVTIQTVENISPQRGNIGETKKRSKFA